MQLNYKFTIVIILLLLAATGLIAADAHTTDETVSKVISGEYTLQCYFQDGWRVVHPQKVVDFNEGRWVFTNGAASQCKVEQINDDIRQEQYHEKAN